MNTRCCRCGSPASSSMGYDYGTRHIWLDDASEPTPPGTYLLCERHAGRMTPPVGWTLADHRAAAPLLPFRRDVA